MELDPRNLSTIYFSTTNSNEKHCYVNSNIEVSQANVVHGRGLIATKDIVAGECLFVTSPAVCVDQDELRKLYQKLCRKEGDEVNSVSLEDIAIDMLITSMTDIVKGQHHKSVAISETDRHDHVLSCAALNSFLELMGSSVFKNDTSLIEVLIGKDINLRWCNEELNKLSYNDLKQIVLKNAFGPETISYETLSEYWMSDDCSLTVPHLLGVYPLAAIVNHSCVANTIRTYASDTMICHASSNISKGQEIVWSYCPPTQSVIERRLSLKRSYSFICQCKRCKYESTHLKGDMLPSTLKKYLSGASTWNQFLLYVSETDTNESINNLFNAFQGLDDHVFGSSLSNELKRFIRISYTKLHFNYFNAILSSSSTKNEIKVKLLKCAAQLHFAFIGTDCQASTEHLSLLHLCYDLASSIKENAPSSNAQFWAKQLKQVHMIRYGVLGNDLENVRTVMVHTKKVLRQRDGFLKSNLNFL